MHLSNFLNAPAKHFLLMNIKKQSQINDNPALLFLIKIIFM